MAIDYKGYSYHKYMDGVEITETDTGIIISEFS
ncbi:Uncharacterised protein [Bacillus paralicheniformis]|jgi:hypothetical protein|nr:hypothetical protein DJ88_4235 [Bacillus paralicheniformis]KUL13557.1 hypothetical protein LI7559_06630 [Bacillus licheniformis LMG 7559]KUL17732.1 hypothetical protein LI6934_09695 [Bacillus licheniformis LMG 6934]VEB17247.1 Uncharacterised protein [Bacillus paralicheniformis]